MITERDLLEAIAECRGQKNPTSSTCIKLAAYLTILDHMTEKEEAPEPIGYSSAPAPTIPKSGDSEFAQRVSGREYAEVWPEVVSLVEAVSVVNPRLYNSFISRL